MLELADIFISILCCRVCCFDLHFHLLNRLVLLQSLLLAIVDKLVIHMQHFYIVKHQLHDLIRQGRKACIIHNAYLLGLTQVRFGSDTIVFADHDTALLALKHAVSIALEGDTALITAQMVLGGVALLTTGATSKATSMARCGLL